MVFSVLSSYVNFVSLEHGKEVHEDIIISGFQFDIFGLNALIDMHVKFLIIDYGCKVFDKISKRDVVSWNSMILWSR